MVGIARAHLVVHREVVAHHGLALVASLRGHHYHAVGGLGAVDGRGRSVFQHVDALDVLGVDAGDGVSYTVHVVGVVELLGRYLHGVLHHYAVYHPQGLTVADERRCAADAYLRRHAHLKRVVVDQQVGYLALEHLVERAHVGALQVFHLGRGDGRRQRPLVEHLVAGHHHLVERLVVGVEYDLRRMAGKNGARGAVEAQVAHLHRQPLSLGEYLEVAVGVGGGAGAGALYLHRGPLQRLAVGVDHRSADRRLALLRGVVAGGPLQHDGLAAYLIGQAAVVEQHAMEQRAEREVGALARHVGQATEHLLLVNEVVARALLQVLHHLLHGLGMVACAVTLGHCRQWHSHEREDKQKIISQSMFFSHEYKHFTIYFPLSYNPTLP